MKGVHLKCFFFKIIERYRFFSFSRFFNVIKQEKYYTNVGASGGCSKVIVYSGIFFVGLWSFDPWSRHKMLHSSPHNFPTLGPQSTVLTLESSFVQLVNNLLNPPPFIISVSTICFTRRRQPKPYPHKNVLNLASFHIYSSSLSVCPHRNLDIKILVC